MTDTEYMTTTYNHTNPCYPGVHCMDRIVTIEHNPTMIVNHISYGNGPASARALDLFAAGDEDEAIAVLATIPPAEITLTTDGRHYDRTQGWHTGPESDETVYVERWTPDGRQFHGYIDAVTRRLVQAG